MSAYKAGTFRLYTPNCLQTFPFWRSTSFDFLKDRSHCRMHRPWYPNARYSHRKVYDLASQAGLFCRCTCRRLKTELRSSWSCSRYDSWIHCPFFESLSVEDPENCQLICLLIRWTVLSWLHGDTSLRNMGFDEVASECGIDSLLCC